jgi:hypothetical protein
MSTPPPPGQKKEGFMDQMSKHVNKLGEHATNAFSGLFPKKKTPPTTTAPGLTGGRSRRRRRSRSRSRSRKGGNPKKGMASKSRKGRKDFVTHKGDKYYNRKGHRQSRNAKGKRKSPYRKH